MGSFFFFCKNSTDILTFIYSVMVLVFHIFHFSLSLFVLYLTDTLLFGHDCYFFTVENQSRFYFFLIYFRGSLNNLPLDLKIKLLALIQKHLTLITNTDYGYNFRRLSAGWVCVKETRLGKGREGRREIDR